MEYTGSNPVQPANAIADPARRWERLIPVTIPMFALALLGVFLLPAHGNIEIYLHLLILATLTLFFFIRYQVRKLRKPVGEQGIKTPTFTGYQRARYQPNGSPLKRKSTTLSEIFLGVVGPLAILAEIHMLVVAITPYFNSSPSTPVSYTMATVSLMMALLSVCIGSLTLLLRGGRPEKIISGRPLFYGSISIFLVLLPATTFLTFQVPRYLFVGPPAPWPTLLAVAQGQADRISKDAVLRTVSARPPYDISGPYSPQNTLLEVRFTFYKSLENIDVIVLDVDPPRLLSSKKTSFYRSFPGGSSSELQAYEERSATVKLSPREAYALTEEEGLAFSTERNSTVSPIINLDVGNYLQGSLVEPTTWTIRYLVEQSSGSSALYLHVDSATGKIVGRQYWP